jgi:high-affinity iron transporter
MKGEERKYQRPVCIGAAAAFLATVLTWCIAVRIVDDLAKNLPALAVQAATGLLAILVLLVVMNWFFHKVYWTGWISLHNRRKQRLLAHDRNISSGMKVLLGLAFLGFASLYREGFEVVLFLQRYRLELGLPSCFGESL